MNEWRVNTDNDEGCMRGLAADRHTPSAKTARRRQYIQRITNETSAYLVPSLFSLHLTIHPPNPSTSTVQIAGRFFHFIRVARDFSLLPTPPSHIPSAPYTTLASNSKAAAEKQVSICLVGTAFA
ncbi:hypothetical protein EYR40_003135 [Pleurotus pulmonarius]|nr:hypothetical protein EYR40_003135 [Pleurotus pulmonarius]